MATNIHNTPVTKDAERVSAGPRCGASVRALFAGLGAAVRRVFALIWPKSRSVPIIHEDVTLTPEGVEIWKQMMNPDSPVGKPTHHRRRRLAKE